jgi:pyruvate/2-oxoglutarate dehydrogenase complex dihydrolipoamide dehydrogenase (E3) component
MAATGADERFGLLPQSSDDARLLQLVRPNHYVNPRPHPKYDLVVIGGGTAGLVAAIGAAVVGARVALAERKLLGGDCLNFGCVPSKALLRAAHAAHEAKRFRGLGIAAGEEPAVDFAQVMERLRAARAEVAPHDALAQVASFGVDVFLGSARFVAEDAVDVSGATLRFRRAIVASGESPAVPEVPGLREAGYLTNETVFSVTTLPRRMVVLGGGPIGCELSQAFRRLGSDVTVLQRGERLLPRDDADAARLLADSMERDGIKLMFGCKILRVDVDGTRKTVEVESGGTRREFPADAILVAVGRAPSLAELGLDAASVETDQRGIVVDDHLRTSNGRVYAAGDVCSKFKYTHAADALARVALQNSLFFLRKRASKLVIPWCTYTDPEVAHVGIDAREAASTPGCTTRTLSFTDLDRAIVDDDRVGFARVHVGRRGRLLGATIVGRNAGELIGGAVLAMEAGLTLAKLGSAIVPYPTRSELWKRLADEHARTRLTPSALKVLRLFLGAMR